MTFGEVIDANAFIFSIRPTLKAYGFAADRGKCDTAYWYYNEKFGPIFGNGSDIWITDECNKDKDNGCNSVSFEFDAKVLAGCNSNEDDNANYAIFDVTDYEVFAVEGMNCK